MGNNFTRRNHFIPQNYQLGFSDDDSKVCIYDRVEKLYDKRHPINVGVKRDFYTTVDEHGVENDSVEKLFTLIEGLAWPVIRKLDGRETHLTTEERNHLALFVACMKTRIPAYEQKQNSISRAILDALSKGRIPTPRGATDEQENVVVGSVPKETVEAIYALIHDGRCQLHAPRQNNIKAMLDTAVEIGKELGSMNWTVYTTSPISLFVTSDNPFVLLPPPGFIQGTVGFGILTPGATSLIPLSKQTLLSMHNYGAEAFIYKKAPADFVRYINGCVAGNSERFIIARDESQLKTLIRRIKADQWLNIFEVTAVD
jgi:hypothetical protein